MTIVRLLTLLVFLPCFYVAPLAAIDWYDEEIHKPNREYIEKEPWKEGESDLPAFPQEGNLVDLGFDYPGSRFRYFIDSESLQIGDDDVIRYTLVIRSASGASNVMFEGMHCGDKAYKTYGYATGKGKFQLARKPKWRPIRKSGSRRFRLDMWTYYFCFAENDSTPSSREEILRAIRYPDNLNRP